MNNDFVRVGLVGYGMAGSVFHAPLIRACARLELAAVLSSREAPVRVDSLDALLVQSDLVVVASPNSSHFSIAKQALEAGKHVVVDKPFTVTTAEADELIQFAHKRRRVLSVFHNRRLDSDFRTIVDVMPRLGEIMLFEAHWDRFRPAIKKGWREVAQPGGGLFNDLGPHLVDQALQLFGEPDALQADIFSQREAANVDDYFDVTLHYRRRRVCLRSSSLVAAPRPRFSIHGTKGSFVKHGLDPQEAQLKSGLDPSDRVFGLDTDHGKFVYPDGIMETVPTLRGNYTGFYNAIAGAILDGAPVPVAAEEARRTLVLMELARRASNEGRRIPVEVSSSREG